MAQRPRILVIGTDGHLAREITDASASWGADAPVVEFAEGARRGVELARSRQPDLILIQTTTDLAESSRLLSRLSDAAPNVPVVATFSRDLFAGDIAEETFFVEGMRAGYRDFLKRPIATEDLRRLLANNTQQQPKVAAEQHGTITAVVSNKGGVGKSSLAVNLAVALAKKHPDDVLLFDTSVQMGVCASMLAIEPTTTLTDAARAVDRLDATLLRQLTLVHESGLHVLAAPTDSLESIEINDELISQILTVARSTYRYILVDTFPLFDRLIVAVLDYTDLACIVLDNSVPTVVGCNQFLGLLDQINFAKPSRRIVVNRFKKTPSYPSRREVEERLACEVDYLLPEDKQLAISTNIGQPLTQRAPLLNRWTAKCHEIAREIESLHAAARSSTAKNGQKAAVQPTNGDALPCSASAISQQPVRRGPLEEVDDG